ncbi:MAG: cytochrome-c peroxidase [Kofleriaceae bacterium]
MKTFLPLVLLAGCGEHGSTPEPFGVPITGGTMIVSGDGLRAIVSDPDRDRVVTMELETGKVLANSELTVGDEPGRLVEDGAGRVHVALRRGSSVVTFDSAGTVLDRRYACGAPRGIAYEAATDSLHVACAGGELVSFPAAGGAASRVVHLDRDLRDVIVSGNQLVVTRFRTAELITLDATGAIVNRVTPPPVQRFDSFGGLPPDQGGDGSGVVNAAASTAWRTIALPDGRIVMSHQRKVKDSLDSEQPGGYGGDCGGGPIEDALSIVTPGSTTGPLPIGQIGRAALPVDIAVSRTGDKIALVSAGNRRVTVVPTNVALTAPDEDKCEPPPPPPNCDDRPPTPGEPTDPSDDGAGVPSSESGECCKDDNFDGRCDDDDDDDDDGGDERLGPPTSVAFTPSGDLVIFYPEAPALIVRTNAGTAARRIALPGKPANDAGRNVFHAQTRIGLACASCHPEGMDDGLTWNFAQFGARRTQSLAGHILERAPYHWTGDQASLPVLMDDVFAQRMSGGFLTEREKNALGPWLNRIAAPAPAEVDGAAALRGKDIFESASTGCVSCHNGALMTNNSLVNVGTGGKFKVPSLIGVGNRAPFMHDGCAATLMDRFTTCGNTAAHGITQNLSTEQLGDLVSYLNSL